MKGLTNASGGILGASIGTEQLVDGGVTPQKLSSGAIPVVKSITLNMPWTGSTSPYSHAVTVTGYTITNNTKIDLQPSASAIQQMINDGVAAIWIENNNGTLTAFAVDGKPTASMTIQCLLQEVRT